MVEVSRRSVARGTVWAVPSIAVAAAAPAVAASSTLSAKMGMFNTVDANGYGYDSGGQRGAGPIQQGMQQGTLTEGDQNWSDSTGYPTVKEGYPGATSHVINEQGSYTPGGTGGTTYGQNYYGTGMWLSSPTNSTTGAAAAGTTTLNAGATFQMCLKIVAVTKTTAGAPSGYTQTTSLSANSTSNGTRLAMNGVNLTLTPSAWSVSGPDANGLYTGTGCITFTTQADLTISNGGTTASPTLRYTQLSLTPGLTSIAGLGNGTMLYCSTLSFMSGTITAQSSGGSAVTVTPELGTVTSYVRAQYDQSTTNWGGGTKLYTGSC